jgi:xanthine/CO dehydrogenase XdhC/CoxF family maturation factor
MVGNISGGCLEGEVQEAAREVMKSGAHRLLRFDLTADDEAVWGWGLGCNGVIDVFVEPAEQAAEVAEALRLALEEDRPIAHVTVIESAVGVLRAGSHMAVHANGRREGTLDSPDGYDLVFAEEAEHAIQDGLSQIVTIATKEGEIRAFVEVLEPPPRVLVCGAGHDAIPLVRHASSLGWRVTVADDRDAFLTPERFAEAGDFVHTEPDKLGGATKLDRRTHAVVMTHNFLRDLGYLRSLFGTEVAYIGMLGPKARLERLLENLARDGVKPSDEDLAKIHGPAGLDVGAEGPEEIAAAIVAEILAVRQGRAAGFLRDRKGSIHGRPEPSGTLTTGSGS